MDTDLDRPDRYSEIRERILGKGFLREFYREVYSRYRECLERCPDQGRAIELGSGAGFLKDELPGVITTDVIPYTGVDQVVDARALPYEDGSLKAILMFDVFHHIPDVGRFLSEAQRCLVEGGRVLIVDQYLGWVSRPILKYAHSEPFDDQASQWAFESKGPVSDANGALAWMVFERDRSVFRRKYPKLRIESYSPHSPLCYWVSGGLKRWTLAPGAAYPLFAWMDRLLVRTLPRMASFVDIELVKQN